MKDTIKMDKPAEEKKPFPRWAIFLIVALVLAVAGGAAYMMYRRRGGNMVAPSNAPGINAGTGSNAGSMPGPTTGANANPTSLNAGGAPPAGVNVRAAANRV
jgi:flagellar basal body-associated protein FliL